MPHPTGPREARAERAGRISHVRPALERNRYPLFCTAAQIAMAKTINTGDAASTIWPRADSMIMMV
jgi:hypothetical protein